MNVIVPFTRVEPLVEAALAGIPSVWTYTGADGEAYWRTLAEAWGTGSGFAVVEHDVVPQPGSVEAMAACPEDWCAVPYGIGASAGTALGCVKFGERLLARHPRLLADVPENGRDWRGLDASVIGELHRRGEREHVHGPAARHLHWENPQKEAVLATLRWTGDGSRYLHEDAQAGIPPMPPHDFDTDDPRVISIAVGSGLYTEDASGDTPRRGRRQAAAPDGPVADTSASAD